MPKVAYLRRQRKGERHPARVKIKKDDLVRVIAGRDKGKTGKVLEVDRFARKVVVDGVMLLTSGGVPTRVGYKLEPGPGGKMRRIRIAKKGGETLERK